MNLGELRDQLNQVSRQDVPDAANVAVIDSETGEIWMPKTVVIEWHEDAQVHTVWVQSEPR